MRDMRYFGCFGLVIASGLIAYFSAYFTAADYVDVGGNNPMYLLRYRVGSVSLDRFAAVFEPARRLDDLFLRHRGALVLHRSAP